MHYAKSFPFTGRVGRDEFVNSEILPVCLNSQTLASEILSGKSSVDANVLYANAAYVQPPAAVPNREDHALDACVTQEIDPNNPVSCSVSFYVFFSGSRK